MSGEGLICARRAMPAESESGSAAPSGSATAGEEVLADVLAYLWRRHANAELVAKRAPELEPLAADRRQQLEVIIGDLEAGLHEGSAAVRERLSRPPEAEGVGGTNAEAGRLVMPPAGQQQEAQ